MVEGPESLLDVTVKDFGSFRSPGNGDPGPGPGQRDHAGADDRLPARSTSSGTTVRFRVPAAVPVSS